MNRWLVVMAKQPRAGRVKSRLARDVGAVEATRFYRVTLQRLIRRLGRDRRWTTVLAVSPDGAAGDPVWPRGVPVIGGVIGAGSDGFVTTQVSRAARDTFFGGIEEPKEPSFPPSSGDGLPEGVVSPSAPSEA